VDEDVCLVLPGLHAISGCDSVSAFSGKGTSKVFDPVSKNQNFCQTLCRVGNPLSIACFPHRKIFRLFLIKPRTILFHNNSIADSDLMTLTFVGGDKLLRYELGSIPWSIATTGGCLVKTNKAALSSIIEKGSEHNGVLLNQSVWIFDAMALIQSMKNIP
jgi:hypothetical protein